MQPYPKTPNVFARDKVTGKIIHGKWSTPEIAYLSNLPWAWYEKIDGTNMRVIVHPQYDKVEVLGRTDKAELNDGLLDRVKTQFTDLLPDLRIMFPHQICFFGEGIGKKIQGSLYGPDYRFILFAIKTEKFWYPQSSVYDIGGQLKIETAPIVGRGPLPLAIDEVRGGLNSRLSGLHNCKFAEGLIVHPVEALLDSHGQRVIAKIKHKDFFGA